MSKVKHFDRIVVPVQNALTSFIDAEDIGELTAKILSEPEQHLNRGYSITGSEAINYYTVGKILSEELGRKITYANPTPPDQKLLDQHTRSGQGIFCSDGHALYDDTHGSGKKDDQCV